MEKQYVYRKHIGMLYKIMPIIFACIAFFAATISIIVIFINMGNTTAIALAAIFGGLITAIFAIYAVATRIFFGRFVKVSVTINDDFIIYKNYKGITKIPVDQIQRLEFPSIKYTGGWLKIIYPGGNIRLTVVLERIGDFIKELKSALDKKDMQNSYNRKAMFSFYKTAEFADQSWDRLYRIFVKLMLFMLSIVLFGILLIFFTYAPLGFIWLMASLSLFLVAFSVSEFIIATRIAKKSNEDEFTVAQRDPHFEKKVYKTAFAIFEVFYVLVSVLLVALTQLL